uniref:Putative papain-like cysteine prorease n=1 Tax=Plasmodium hylobati TaxID=77520 RepID=F1SYZ1_PLAHY|nr:putative papain-like cysteine prorease [Plasmodium hylobati]
MRTRLCGLLILYMLLNRHSVKCATNSGSGEGSEVSNVPSGSLDQDPSKSSAEDGTSSGSATTSPSQPPSGGGDTPTQVGTSHSTGQTNPAPTHSSLDQTHSQIANPDESQNQGSVGSTTQNSQATTTPSSSTIEGVSRTATASDTQTPPGTATPPAPQGPAAAQPPAAAQTPSASQTSDAAQGPPAAQPPSATQLATPTPASSPNPIQVKSFLLRDHKGLRITGPCKSSFFQVYLVPYLYINVNAANTEIEMDPMFMKVDEKIKFEKEKHLLQNICADNKTFKLVLYLHEDELIIKWKVYPAKGRSVYDRTVDIRKYRMKDIGQPITSIQVVVATQEDQTLYLESKNFSLVNDIPEQCDAIANECFMSGVLDVQKCYHCTLLMQEKQNVQECFKFVAPEIRNRFDDIQTKGENAEDPNEVELEQSIHSIMDKIYKKGENLYKEVDQLAILDSSFKSELLKYCSLMKEIDASGALENHQLGNADEVFSHITTMLQNNSDHDAFSLKSKFKNPALCLKKVDHWIGGKTGLVLPSLEYSNEQNNADSTSDATTLQTLDVNPLHVKDKLFCNEDYCDRTKDTSSCMAKIEAEDQGDCATSWVFASKMHLETIKCIKGYEHVPTSALYVANCSNKDAKDKCQAPSNPVEFLDILEETKFLPAESDLPYSYKQVGDVCPDTKTHWKNLWANVKLLNKQNGPNALNTKGYTAYESAKFEGNMDAFTKLVKSEVMNKGSVIAYVKAAGALSYDLNGKKVLSLCGGETPDLAVNIIGYGNYINEEGVKKSYWLVRNSWGKYWGEDGNFKVDMDGPAGCKHNFIHTAAVFNVDIPVVVPAPNTDPEINNYYLKHSPDFLNNFYLNKREAEKVNGLGDGKGPIHNSVLYGQTEEGQEGKLPEGSTGEPGVAGAKVAEGEPGVAGAAGSPAGAGVPGAAGSPGEPGEQEEKSKEEAEEETEEEEDEEDEDDEEDDGPKEEATTVTVPTGTGTNPGEQPDAVDTNSVNSNSGNSAPTANQAASSVTTDLPVDPSKGTGSTSVDVKGITGVLHFLKNVKNGKVTSNFVAYDSDKVLGDKACSRVQTSDIDKLAECVNFCEENWNDCKGKVSPGYCLAKKRGNNDCFFCFV